MNEELSLSIIICTKDRCIEVLACVKSILKQTCYPQEVIIVDSSEDRILEKELKILLVESDITLNYSNIKANLTKARNIGIGKSKGEVLTFLDDDTILGSRYLEEILTVFRSYPSRDIGGVSGNIVNANQGRMRDFFNKIFFLFRYSDGKFRLSGIQTFVKKNVKETVMVEGLSGANMSFRKSLIETFGFDESSPCSEDDDVAWRVSREYANIYTPFALIEHNPSEVGGGYGKRSERWEKEFEGLYNHFRKNMPLTIKHKIAFNIALLGYAINELINVMLLKKGAVTQFVGVLRGIKSIYYK